MSDSGLSFRYRLEQEKPRLGPGGITRGASVREFPASIGIAGVSMRLEPGAMRELHWHANAAEWGYVVSGNCRTTIVHPDGGSATDEFGPGDVWYFPARLGPFDPGHRARRMPFHSDLRQWRFLGGPHLQRDRLAVAHAARSSWRKAWGIGAEEVARLPKGEVYFAKGPVPDDRSTISAARTRSRTGRDAPLPAGAQEPRRVPGGGTQRTVTVEEFPISTTMAGSLLEIEPGAMRELHWHPNADEWQYYLEGSAEMSVFLAQGKVVTEQFEAGDVGYAPMGAGHYIRNTGPGVLRVLIGFNNGRYESNDLSAWLATNPVDVLATNLGIPRDVASEMPREGHFFVPRR